MTRLAYETHHSFANPARISGRFCLTVLLAFTLPLLGCQSQNDSGSSEAADSTHYRIGITQIATHPGIEQVRRGFIEEMATQGYSEGENVTYARTNADGDFSQAQSIAQKFASGDYDLIFSISTPSTQALVDAMKGKDTPLVFGAITDPVSAGIVDSLANPPPNITGTTDIWPINKQFNFLKQLVPGVKRVGVLHDPSEANSEASVELATKAAKKHNLELVKVPVSSSNDVPAAARSLMGRVDAIYIPASNTVISAISSVVAVAEENGIPLMPGDPSNVEIGGFGTIGHNYHSVGAESGRIAAKILEGTPPGQIPVQKSPQQEYFFNVESARKMGVTIPDSLLSKAAEVYGRGGET